MGKGDRTENPAREYQKEERKRELERNKAQRQMSREIHKLQHAPSYQVRSELQKLMDLDKAGKLNSTLRTKMGALQGVYKDALVREQTNPSAVKPVVRGSRDYGVWVAEPVPAAPAVKEVEINLGSENLIPPALRRRKIQPPIQKKIAVQPPPVKPEAAEEPKEEQNEEPKSKDNKSDDDKDDDLLAFEEEMKRIGVM